jgi:hypothetical protein
VRRHGLTWMPITPRSPLSQGQRTKTHSYQPYDLPIESNADQREGSDGRAALVMRSSSVSRFVAIFRDPDWGTWLRVRSRSCGCYRRSLLHRGARLIFVAPNAHNSERARPQSPAVSAPDRGEPLGVRLISIDFRGARDTGGTRRRTVSALSSSPCAADAVEFGPHLGVRRRVRVFVPGVEKATAAAIVSGCAGISSRPCACHQPAKWRQLAA